MECKKRQLENSNIRTARRSSQYILKEISPECSLEGPILKLKLQYFGQLMRRTDSLEKTLMKIEGGRRRGRQRMKWLDGITDAMVMSLSSGDYGWLVPQLLCPIETLYCVEEY